MLFLYYIIHPSTPRLSIHYRSFNWTLFTVYNLQSTMRNYLSFMINLLHVLASTREIVDIGILIQEILSEIFFYDLCFIVFYLVQYGGLYFECKNKHGALNMKFRRKCACVYLKYSING